MKKFEKIVETVFDRKKVPFTPFIIIESHIPKKFKNFLNSFISLIPKCKIIHFSKNQSYVNIEELMGEFHSTVLIASYNRKTNLSYITIRQTWSKYAIKLIVLNLTQVFSKIFFGNANKWSRSLFIFENIFEERPELKTFKILITSFLNSKIYNENVLPSYENVFSFFYVNSKIILRIYQIVKDKKSKKNFNLVEIGPRFRLRVKNFKME